MSDDKQTAREECPLCKGERRVLYHGAGTTTADLRNCPQCGDGEFVEHTDVPNVQEAPSV